MITLSRRAFVVASASTAAMAALVPPRARADAGDLITRTVPSTGELLPAVGLGTWQAFDIDPEGSDAKSRLAVLEKFFELGGKVIDTSPMYGRAEEAIGDLLDRSGRAGDAFLATKVWTRGKKAGIAQMRGSMKKLRASRIDLMQVHNLVDWRKHLATLRAWKREGLVRAIGVTHYALDELDTIEAIVAKQSIDFIQVPYSIAVRKADERVLPAAKDAGVAVLVMRPFEGGDLFARVKDRPLPALAREIDCESWAQYFLKFIIANPAVTSPIPATTKLRHLTDNMAAGRGRLPDEATRKKMIASIAD